MRYLGIDHGDKRIGIALSDEEGRIAFPLLTINNNGNAPVSRALKELIQKEHIERMVMGLPVSLDGRETDQTKKVRSFTAYLERHIDISVVFKNEMLTSHMAEREGIKKEHIDESSAALILQSYLDRINHY